ncbi:hypothetical protein GCM10011361_20170 [Muriicola marianensis]|uniref:Inner membrane protein YgaP-like transmembrane domain-containing protein n=2 Tax=Muriicola marianensis TaxID=1324801 RepID=A0ABQ1R479_9FLAO|nr:hypothetical protein GCM10011361_20170 [Muriicola marianensis]
MVTAVTAQVVFIANLCRAIVQQPQKFNAMKKNMGSTDRVIRIVIAAVIGVLYYTGTISGTLGLVLVILAAVFLLTSFVSFCPLYAPFGISTCPVKDK